MSTRACNQPRTRWRGLSLYLAPASITLLAFALYLHGLESKGLWFDELGTLTCAGWGASVAEAIRRQLTIPVIPKPPLHYLVVRLFMALGNQVFWRYNVSNVELK